MSILSESLERCLRQLQNPTKATVAVAPMKVPRQPALRSISLYYKQGSSDKEYHVQIIKEHPLSKFDEYVVNFQYGRCGSVLKRGTKTEAPVSLSEARDIYDSVVKEKMAKGYKE
jgi:hypothetical protein